MSIQSRIRKKQRREFDLRLRLNKGYDRKIGAWKMIDIHQIPLQINIGDEFDFWCHNRKDLYLLRLKKAKSKRISVIKSEGRDAVIYLIVEFDFENINNEAIKNIIISLEKIGIPSWKIGAINIRL